MNLYQGMTPVEVAAGGADVQGVEGATGLRLLKVTARESAGSAAVATIQLHHGTDANGDVIDVIELEANGDDVRDYTPYGIPVPDGVFVNRLAGESQLVLFTNS